MEASAVHQENKKHHKLVEVTLITIDDESGDQVEEEKLVEKGKTPVTKLKEKLGVGAQPDRLVYFIRQHGQAAKVRPDMKVVFFQNWETPEERLMGTTEIMRQLANLAEDRKAA